MEYREGSCWSLVLTCFQRLITFQRCLTDFRRRSSVEGLPMIVGMPLRGSRHPSSSLSFFPFTLTQKGTILFHRGLPAMMYCRSTDLKVLEATNHGLTPLKL